MTAELSSEIPLSLRLVLSFSLALSGPSLLVLEPKNQPITPFVLLCFCASLVPLSSSLRCSLFSFDQQKKKTAKNPFCFSCSPGSDDEQRACFRRRRNAQSHSLPNAQSHSFPLARPLLSRALSHSLSFAFNPKSRAENPPLFSFLSSF